MCIVISIYMEAREMVLMKLFAGQESRHKCRGQPPEHREGGRRWRSRELAYLHHHAQHGQLVQAAALPGAQPGTARWLRGVERGSVGGRLQRRGGGVHTHSSSH